MEATLSAFCEAWAFQLRISECGLRIEKRIVRVILVTTNLVFLAGANKMSLSALKY
jgi:hypothetical protein